MREGKIINISLLQNYNHDISRIYVHEHLTKRSRKYMLKFYGTSLPRRSFVTATYMARIAYIKNGERNSFPIFDLNQIYSTIAPMPSSPCFAEMRVPVSPDQFVFVELAAANENLLYKALLLRSTLLLL